MISNTRDVTISPPAVPLDGAILNTPFRLRHDLDDFALADDDFWMSTPHYQHQHQHNLDWMLSADPYLTPRHLSTDSSSTQQDFYSFTNQTTDPSWQQDLTDGFASYPFNQPSPRLRQRPHRRALSNSTQASQTSTSSPQSTAFQQRSLLDNHYYPQLKNQFYPTPIGTPTQDNFMEQGYGGRSRPQVSSAPLQQGPVSAAPYPSYPAQIRTSGPQFQPQSYYGPGYPATPNSAQGVYPGGDARYSGHQNVLAKVPRLEPTMTQACADELFSPETMLPQQQQHQIPNSNPNLLTPSVHERLQAANEARASRSPIDNAKREPSPYREGSHWAGHGDPSFARSQDGPVGTAAQQRQQQKWQDDQYQQWRHHHRGADPQQQPQTISPKDAYVDDFRDPAEDSSAPPLFPQRSQSNQHLFDDSYTRSGYGPVNGGVGPGFPNTSFSFTAPGVPASANLPSHPNGSTSDFKFAPISLVRQSSSSDADTPAHLISMETSKSEQDSSQDLAPQQSHQQQQAPARAQHRDAGRPRPTASGSISSADTGTYSCTYANCPQRFATPALLQKHKRDAHRPAGPIASSSRQPSSATATSSPVVSGSEADRNSQAGPHRCDRINPSTGKSCNTVFSRPYDLTRHEDTIHARRPKVHCQYCADRGEEKTFSRADALTRHLRVVHPEVEVYGKLGRRRGL